MATKPWGIFQPGAPTDMSKITSIASLVHSTPGWIVNFKNFAGTNTAYTASDFTNVLNYGATPIFTWEPHDNTNQVTITNAMVTAGNYDSLIDSYANGIKALSGTVLIRLAHEMNGNWYDWAVGVNGNTVASYIAMWQYVVNRFRNAGCTNAKWVYCPNREYVGQTCTYAQAYPGDAYVDYLAIDVYNLGDPSSGHAWQTWLQLAEPSLTDIKAVSPAKPLFIAEMACSELGGQNKAAWIQDTLMVQFQNDSRIAFFCYFNAQGTSAVNGPFTSSNDATQAFASALQTQTGFSRFSAHV